MEHLHKQEAKVGAVKRILEFLMASLDTDNEETDWTRSSIVVHLPSTSMALGLLSSIKNINSKKESC